MTNRPKKLLGVSTDAKTTKGEKKGYLTGILYLAPADLSGYEVCPMRSAGCTAACLNTAGRGVFRNVQASRLAKTKWYFEDRAGFMAQLIKDVEALIRKADRAGLIPVVRLNGTSDIPWERVPAGDEASIMALFPGLQFYDYTKITKRALAHARGEFPANYHITFSLTEDNDAAAIGVLRAGGNVAAVFKPTEDGHLPPSMVADHTSKFLFRCAQAAAKGSWPVIDGDATDLRFTDEDEVKVQGMASLKHSGVVVGLKAKGKARKDTSGFVR